MFALFFKYGKLVTIKIKIIVCEYYVIFVSIMTVYQDEEVDYHVNIVG